MSETQGDSIIYVDNEDIQVTEHRITYKVSVKDIIFLPFNNYIIFVFLIVNAISIHVYLFVLVYFPFIKSDFLYTVIVVIEVFYLMHTFLLVLHWGIKSHRKKRLHKPVNVFFIIVDVITIIPISTVYKLMQRFTWTNKLVSRTVLSLQSIVKFLRIIRIYYFYWKYTSSPGLPKKVILPLFYIIVTTIAAQAFGVFYYHISCYACKVPNWSNRLMYIDFDDSDDAHWMIVCFTYCFSLQIHNTSGYVRSETMYEVYTALICIVTGFIFKFFFMTGSLIAEHIRSIRFKYTYENKVKSILNFMSVLEMDDNKYAVKKYYNSIWESRRGITKVPSLFKIFPPSLQNEVLTDIYWNTIMHSILFSQFDDSFKRRLSEIMKTEIFMSGHNLFQVGKLKTKLLYLSAGILEVMSAENSESSILSLSTGTIIGEFSCVIPTVSSVNIRCSTTCEVHSLDHADLYKLLRGYRRIDQQIKKTVMDRIKNAKLKQNLLINMENYEAMTHIYWIKYQWRRLTDYKIKKNQKAAPMGNFYYSSKFLSLLVLSSHEQLKVQSICLRGKCLFVMDPKSSLRQFIYYLCLLAVVLQTMISVPLIIFKGIIPKKVYPFMIILDLIYFLDIYVQSITAVEVGNVLVTKPSQVFLYWSKQMFFILDIIATIPYDYIAELFAATNYEISLVRLPRMLKLYKLWIFFNEKENSLNINIIAIKFIKFLCLNIIFILLSIGLIYMSNCLMGKCDQTGWLAAYFERINSNNISKVVITIYYSISSYLSIILTDIFPNNIKDLCIINVVKLIGFLMEAFCIVQLSSSWALISEDQYNYMIKIEDLESFIYDRRELRPLKHKILKFIELQYILVNNEKLPNIWNVLGQDSAYLKDIIEKKYIKTIFENHPIFRNCCDRMLDMLTNEIEMHIIPEGHHIVKSSTRSFYLYILLKGRCKMTSHVPGDEEKKSVSYYSKNEIFPIFTFFQKIHGLIDVETITAVQVLSLSTIAFNKIMKGFPKEKLIFQKSFHHHLKTHKNIMLLKVDREVPPSRIGTIAFEYTIIETNTIYYSKTYHKRTNVFIKKWRKFVKKLLVTTYDPHGKLFFIHEIIRCCIIAAQIVMGQFYIIKNFHEFRVNSYGIYIMIFFYVSAFVDMFIRFHTQYYNERGAKVTHPLSTMKRYLQTSFVLDLYGIFPFSAFKINHILSSNYRNTILLGLIYTSRPLLLYRPILFSLYLQNNKYIRHTNSIRFCITFTLLVVIVGELASLKAILTCPLSEKFEFECPNNTWLKQVPYIDPKNPYHQYLINYFSIMSATILPGFRFSNLTELFIQLVVTVAVWVSKLTCISLTIGTCIYGNQKLTDYQDNIKHYLKFIRNKILSNASRTEILEHFTNEWKKSKCETPSQIFADVSPDLREAIFVALYRSTIEKCQALKLADDNFLRLLLPHVEERHFKKDADIIRCNDIQNEVFIVSKGSVSISSAGSELAVLHQGGIFGCFDKKGQTRQTINVKAIVHARLLCIDTLLFFQCINEYPTINTNLFIYQHVNYEFTASSDITRRNTSISTKSVIKSGVGLDKTWIVVFCCHYFDENNIWYRLWNYISNVHVAPISSIICLLMIAVQSKGILYALWAPLDFYFLIYIYIRCHVSYTDLESGIKVKTVSLLTKRYMKSLRFFIDLASVLPFYCIYPFKNNVHPGYFICNKLLRIIFLIEYFATFVKKRNVPRHLQWAFLLYLAMFILQMSFNIWTMARKYGKILSSEDISYAYLFIVNVVSTSGLRDTQFTSILELGISLVVIVIAQCLIIYLYTTFSKMLLLQNYNICNYKLNTTLFKTFCQNQQVSPSIIKKSWDYLNYIYMTEMGDQIPRLLKIAPAYIREDHFRWFYYKHFDKHPLFLETHVDFLRQIYRYLKLHLYLPGQTIVEKGDKNATIYFIEQGQIISIYKHNGKYSFEKLEENASFGEVQALYDIPFEKTHKALSKCWVVSLCTNDWAYLLEWFPASKESLYDCVEDNYLQPEESYMEL